MITVERFDCVDGDHWYSLVEDDDLVTCVMHDTPEDARAELDQINMPLAGDRDG